MVQRNFGFVSNQIFNLANFSLGFCFFVFLQVHLLGSYFLDQGVQCEEVDVFEMVVGSIVFLQLLGRLSGVDSLQNTESSEILEGDLKFSDSFSTTNVLSGLASLACLNFPHYIYDC